MGRIFWAFNRQVEAMRESVRYCIDGIHKGGAPLEERRTKWLAGQGMGDFDPELSISDLIEQPITASFSDDNWLERMQEGNRSQYPDAKDFGKLRANGGWDELEKFIITSAFIRILGAYEQYELDVLKALLYYRPLGHTGQHASDFEEEEPTEEVILEQPHLQDNKRTFSKPTIWSWMEKTALSKEERSKILSRVYKIKLESKSYKNSIVTVDVRLCDYRDVNYYVMEIGYQLKEACLSRYRLHI
jgi:hypothetical protein